MRTELARIKKEKVHLGFNQLYSVSVLDLILVCRVCWLFIDINLSFLDNSSTVSTRGSHNSVLRTRGLQAYRTGVRLPVRSYFVRLTDKTISWGSLQLSTRDCFRSVFRMTNFFRIDYYRYVFISILTLQRLSILE